MRRAALLLALLVPSMVPPAARAQPADCVPDPAPPGASGVPMQLYLKLDGLPGAGGRGGYVGGTVPVAPDGTTCGAARPDLPKDVLRGDGPDDPLTGLPRDNRYIPVR